jgi:hypothetical protein
MSNTTRKPQLGSLGDAWDTVKSMSSAVDPYLPEAFCRVDQIRALRKDRTALQVLFGKNPTVPVPTCSTTPPGRAGIGIEKAMKPLRAGAYVYQHPKTVWLGLTVFLAVPMLVGFVIGRKTR